MTKRERTMDINDENENPQKKIMKGLISNWREKKEQQEKNKKKQDAKLMLKQNKRDKKINKNKVNVKTNKNTQTRVWRRKVWWKIRI